MLTGRTELAGRPASFSLATPTYADLAFFFERAPRGTEAEQRWLASRLSSEVTQLDGEPMTLDLARGLVDDPRFVSDFVEARNRMHDEMRSAGVMFALCPGCRRAEAEISFTYLTKRLLVSPSPLTTPDGTWLLPPELGERSRLVRPTRRAGLPLTPQIRFELPSARKKIDLGSGIPLGGWMVALDEAREKAAWERFWPDGSQTTSDRAWWYKGSVPFRALVRLAAAIERFDRDQRASPATLERLAAFDIEYLDLAVIATQLTEAPDHAEVTCQRCNTEYLPLL